MKDKTRSRSRVGQRPPFSSLPADSRTQRVLDASQLQKLYEVLDEPVLVHAGPGPASFPHLEIRPSELIVAIEQKLRMSKITRRDTRLNGSAAGYVIASRPSRADADSPPMPALSLADEQGSSTGSVGGTDAAAASPSPTSTAGSSSKTSHHELSNADVLIADKQPKASSESTKSASSAAHTSALTGEVCGGGGGAAKSHTSNHHPHRVFDVDDDTDGVLSDSESVVSIQSAQSVPLPFGDECGARQMPQSASSHNLSSLMASGASAPDARRRRRDHLASRAVSVNGGSPPPRRAAHHSRNRSQGAHSAYSMSAASSRNTSPTLRPSIPNMPPHHADYSDIDMLFHVDFNFADVCCACPDNERASCHACVSHIDAQFNVIRNIVLELLRELLCRSVAAPLAVDFEVLSQIYVQKMFKVPRTGSMGSQLDRWSLISLRNSWGRNIELKFVYTMQRQYLFSIDSFQVLIDSHELYESQDSFHSVALTPVSAVMMPRYIQPTPTSMPTPQLPQHPSMPMQPQVTGLGHASQVPPTAYSDANAQGDATSTSGRRSSSISSAGGSASRPAAADAPTPNPSPSGKTASSPRKKDKIDKWTQTSERDLAEAKKRSKNKKDRRHHSTESKAAAATHAAAAAAAAALPVLAEGRESSEPLPVQVLSPRKSKADKQSLKERRKSAADMSFSPVRTRLNSSQSTSALATISSTPSPPRLANGRTWAQMVSGSKLQTKRLSQPTLSNSLVTLANSSAGVSDGRIARSLLPHQQEKQQQHRQQKSSTLPHLSRRASQPQAEAQRSAPPSVASHASPLSSAMSIASIDSAAASAMSELSLAAKSRPSTTTASTSTNSRSSRHSIDSHMSTTSTATMSTSSPTHARRRSSVLSAASTATSSHSSTAARKKPAALTHSSPNGIISHLHSHSSGAPRSPTHLKTVTNAHQHHDPSSISTSSSSSHAHAIATRLRDRPSFSESTGKSVTNPAFVTSSAPVSPTLSHKQKQQLEKEQQRTVEEEEEEEEGEEEGEVEEEEEEPAYLFDGSLPSLSSPKLVALVRSKTMPRILCVSVFEGGFDQALAHLNRKIVYLQKPWKIRGGGLLKYVNLLNQGYEVVSEDPEYDTLTLETHMVTRYCMDFNSENQRWQSIMTYASSHYPFDPVMMKHFYDLLYDISMRADVSHTQHFSDLVRSVRDTLDHAWNLNKMFRQALVAQQIYSAHPHLHFPAFLAATANQYQLQAQAHHHAHHAMGHAHAHHQQQQQQQQQHSHHHHNGHQQGGSGGGNRSRNNSGGKQRRNQNGRHRHQNSYGGNSNGNGNGGGGGGNYYQQGQQNRSRRSGRQNQQQQQQQRYRMTSPPQSPPQQTRREAKMPQANASNGALLEAPNPLRPTTSTNGRRPSSATSSGMTSPVGPQAHSPQPPVHKVARVSVSVAGASPMLARNQAAQPPSHVATGGSGNANGNGGEQATPPHEHLSPPASRAHSAPPTGAAVVAQQAAVAARYPSQQQWFQHNSAMHAVAASALANNVSPSQMAAAIPPSSLQAQQQSAYLRQQQAYSQLYQQAYYPHTVAPARVAQPQSNASSSSNGQAYMVYSSNGKQSQGGANNTESSGHQGSGNGHQGGGNRTSNSRNGNHGHSRRVDAGHTNGYHTSQQGSGTARNNFVHSHAHGQQYPRSGQQGGSSRSDYQGTYNSAAAAAATQRNGGPRHQRNNSSGVRQAQQHQWAHTQQQDRSRVNNGSVATNGHYHPTSAAVTAAQQQHRQQHDAAQLLAALRHQHQQHYAHAAAANAAHQQSAYAAASSPPSSAAQQVTHEHLRSFLQQQTNRARHPSAYSDVVAAAHVTATAGGKGGSSVASTDKGDEQTMVVVAGEK